MTSSLNIVIISAMISMLVHLNICSIQLRLHLITKVVVIMVLVNIQNIYYMYII